MIRIMLAYAKAGCGYFHIIEDDNHYSTGVVHDQAM